MGDPSLNDRERLVGNGQVVYRCVNQGIPTPTVTWYHNGETIPANSGISMNGNQLVILYPQVENSGVYQCLVSNTIDGMVMEDWREWVLEVRQPGKPNGQSVLP
jgi:hypothetical protein